VNPDCRPSLLVRTMSTVESDGLVVSFLFFPPCLSGSLSYLEVICFNMSEPVQIKINLYTNMEADIVFISNDGEKYRVDSYILKALR